MAQQKNPARRGRPPLPPEKRKRPTMGFRPTPALRQMIEDASATSGLSLTQEVERRLDQSFFLDPVSALAALGFEHKDERSFVQHLGILFNNIRGVSGPDSLFATAESFVEVEAGIYEFFKALRKSPRDFAEDAVAYDIKAGFGRQSGKGLGELFASSWRSDEKLTARMIGEEYVEERPEPKRWRRRKKRGGP